MQLSDNFFREFNVTVLQPIQAGAQRAVINQTLAKMLAPGSDTQQLIGKIILFDDDNSAVQISGIVADLPHAGVRFQQMPMLYRSLQDSPVLEGPVYLYSATELTLADARRLTGLPGEPLQLTALGKLPQQLLDLDGAGTGLFVLTMQISVFVVLLTGVGLFNQMNMQLMNDRQLFGLQLALGQQRMQLISQLCSQHVLLAVVAACGCLAVLH